MRLPQQVAQGKAALAKQNKGRFRRLDDIEQESLRLAPTP
jgi:hypothetical protein